MLERVAQKGCGYAVHGGNRVQVGWDPGQSDLVLDLEAGNPAWSMELEPDDSWGPFQPKPFYDSMIP